MNAEQDEESRYPRSQLAVRAVRTEFGRTAASMDVKRPRALEAENASLKKLLAKAASGIEVLKARGP